MPLDRMISWRLKQKSGIMLEEPNEVLCKSYLKEANDALVSMNVNKEAGLRRWVIITAYYARYYGIYALLKKVGVKSEIHDCSIALMRYLFSDIFEKKFFDELEKAKEQRINLQYYTNRNVSDSDYDKNVQTASDFVLTAENSIDRMSSSEVDEARKKLENLIKSLE